MSAARQTNPLFSVSSVLYASLKQKNVSAFEFLYDKYSTPLYALINSILSDPASADIVFEKIFALSWQKIGSYDPERCSIFTWLYGMAREQAINEKRQQELKRLIHSERPETFNNLVEFKQLVGQIPEPFRSTLMLSYFENASDVEISETINADLSLVKQYRNKGLLIINKLIAGGDEIKKPSPISERVLAF